LEPDPNKKYIITKIVSNKINFNAEKRKEVAE